MTAIPKCFLKMLYNLSLPPQMASPLDEISEFHVLKFLRQFGAGNQLKNTTPAASHVVVEFFFIYLYPLYDLKIYILQRY